MMSNQWTSNLHLLQDRRVVITGATSGLGMATAQLFASCGAHVVLACRDENAGNALATAINSSIRAHRATVWKLDLSSLGGIEASVRKLSRDVPMDCLVNGAAVGVQPFNLTADGYESCFGVNVLGHLQLVRQLLKYDYFSNDARIINVASNAERFIGQVNFQDTTWTREDQQTQTGAYGRSKLMLLLVRKHLQEYVASTYKDMKVITINPGMMPTRLFREQPLFLRFAIATLSPQSIMAGAQIVARAALDMSLPGGSYLVPKYEFWGAPVLRPPSAKANRADQQADAWKLCMKCLG